MNVVESTLVGRTVVRRPGGRTADVTARVHEAIIAILIDHGIHACTFSAVAQRAGIERSTLYRRFPDRWEAIIDALIARAGSDIVPDLGRSFARSLRSVLGKLVENLESPLGSAFIAAAAELRATSGDDYSRGYFDRRMEQLAPMFDAAVERGELASDVDREAVFTFAAGPIYFRLFIAGRRIESGFVESIVESVCARFCTAKGAKVSLPARMA